ncbi:unnamed protein product, partial [Rotaria sp. Silwood1]
TLAQSVNSLVCFQTGQNRFANTSLITYTIEQSPIRLIDQIITLVLLQLSKKDRCIPFSVGLHYYEYLKTSNTPTRSYVDDSNYTLRELPTDSDCFANIVFFIYEHVHLSSRLPGFRVSYIILMFSFNVE